MMLYIRVDALVGATIERAITEAIKLSQKLQVGIQLNFNGKEMYVFPHSTYEEIYNRWQTN